MTLEEINNKFNFWKYIPINLVDLKLGDKIAIFNCEVVEINHIRKDGLIYLIFSNDKNNNGYYTLDKVNEYF